MLMKPITLSLNPSYHCNFRCDFCYLTEEQLSNRRRMSLEKLNQRMSEIPEIKYLDMYGGEIGLMRPEIFYDYKKVIRKYYDGEINIITNLSMLQDYFFDDDVYLSVSYDFDAREKSDIVFQNMLSSPKPIAVLILASPKVLSMDVDSMIHQLNMIGSIDSVEIKPYSTNQANAYKVTHKEFEEFIKKWITSKVKKKFDFINKSKLIESINGHYNAFSDDHVYITPNGNFGVLEFDENDNEYFLELDSYEEFINWTEKEKIGLSPICQTCTYKGRCLTEHYRYVTDITYSCSGYKGLIEWYEDLEGAARNISPIKQIV